MAWPNSEDDLFVFRDVDGPEKGQSLKIAIYRPEPDGADWSARVVLIANGTEIIADKKCFGIDSVQAIQIAFDFIRSELGENYTWLGEPALLGFPRSIPASFGVEFYHQVDASIRREETEFVEDLKRQRSSKRPNKTLD